jgi:molybdopterin converting factor small subunit
MRPQIRFEEGKMQFRLYATFRLQAGVKAVSLDLCEGTTLREAVTALLEQLPVLRPHWLDGAGDLRPYVKIFVNRRELQALENGLDTPLHADAVLDFFPPVGGGSFGK